MVDSRNTHVVLINRWYLSPRNRFLCVDLVTPFAHSSWNVDLIAVQGCEDFYSIDCGSNYTLEAAEDDPDL